MRSRFGKIPALLLSSAFVLSLWPEVAAAQQTRYRLIDVGSFGGADTTASDLNESGVVVGQSDSSTSGRAYVYQNNNLVDLGTLGGPWAFARAINDQGWIAGDATNQNNLNQPVLFRGNQKIVLATTHGMANGINNRGEIVGFYRPSNSHAFHWHNGTFTDLGTMGGSWSNASSINEAGMIVGWSEDSSNHIRGYLWQSGTFQDLGDLGSDFRTMAYDINEKVQIVGMSTVMSGVTHAFMWENGVMTDLGDLGDPWSIAIGINEQEQVVGYSSINGEVTAFLWENGVMTDLNDLIDPNSPYHLRYAFEINEKGEIVGQALLNGEKRGVLLVAELPIVGPLPGIAGVENTMRLGASQPGDTVYFVFGGKRGLTHVPGCPSLMVNLRPPLRTSPRLTAKAGGVATLRMQVPRRLAGLRTLIQGVNRDGCWVSEVVEHVWQ